MAQRLAKKLLVIGWDAADWMVIDPLFAQGKMPNLRALVERGVRSDLRTLEPKLSPLLWTSIATGKTADKHGIHNFVEPKPDGDGLRLSSSTSRRTKALWNILSQNDMTTHVAGWYATHPAEPVRGSVITNMVQEGEPQNAATVWPLTTGAVHPPSMAASVADARQRAHAFPKQELQQVIPALSSVPPSDSRLATLSKLMAYAASIERTAIVAMNSASWDCAMVFFDAIDTVGHHFMQYRPPRMQHVSEQDVRVFGDVMANVYQWHDQALGRLLKTAGPDVTVILVSDHGFHSDHLRPVLVDLPPERRAELESSWHRPLGVLVMAGPGIRANAAPSIPSILDIAPTALALLGLPAGEDFDGRVLSEALTSQDVPARIPSWDAVEGDAGLHPADARQDPFEAVDAIKQLVDLGYMAALPGDVQGQLDLVSRESRFNLAVVLMTTHRHAQAVGLFRALSAEKPSESRYVLSLAQCLYTLSEFAEAIKVLREFLSIEPECAEARLLLAGALSMAGQDAEGLAEIRIVEKVAGKRADLTLPLGDCLFSLERFAEARNYYEAARGTDASNPAGHIGLSRTLLGLKQYEAAAGHALDALDLSQALPEAHYLLGAALAWYGDFESATKSFELTLKYEPQNIDAHRFLYLCSRKLGNRDLQASQQSRIGELASARTQTKEFAFGPRAFAGQNQLQFI